MIIFEIKEVYFCKFSLPNKHMTIEQLFLASPSKSDGSRASRNQSKGITFDQVEEKVVRVSIKKIKDTVWPKMSDLLLNNNQHPDEIARLSTNLTNHLFGDKIVILYPPAKKQEHHMASI